MMGEQRDNQRRLFYSFNLDEHVPADHRLRGINQFLDLSDLRSYLAPFYSHTGRPSIDPELMIRMLIVGYCFGIRSERRLCEEVHLNLAYRWFCRLFTEANSPALKPPFARRVAADSRFDGITKAASVEHWFRFAARRGTCSKSWAHHDGEGVCSWASPMPICRYGGHPTLLLCSG
jgi:Transposase domain (DUF772)